MPFRLLVVLLWLVLSAPMLAQLERAEQLLRSARPSEALAALDGPSAEADILRFQALWQLELYAEAGEQMQQLGEVRSPGLSPAYAIRWHLAKATFHGYLEHYQLAERHLREGLQLATTPRQRLEVFDALVALAIDRDDLPQAEALLKQTELLLPRISDELDLTAHLTMLATFAEQQGRTADTMAMLTSAREIYRRLQHPGHVADVSTRIAWALRHQGDPAASFEQLHLCLEELGRAGYPDGTLAAAGRFSRRIGTRRNFGQG